LFCYFSYLFFVLFFELFDSLHDLHSFPTRRSSDLASQILRIIEQDRLSEHAASTGAYLHERLQSIADSFEKVRNVRGRGLLNARSEEHTSELQSRENLVCRLLLEKKN